MNQLTLRQFAPGPRPLEHLLLLLHRVGRVQGNHLRTGQEREDVLLRGRLLVDVEDGGEHRSATRSAHPPSPAPRS